MTRLLITGSRDWSNYTEFSREVVRFIAEHCPMGYDSFGNAVDYDTSDLVIVHGACPTGADYMAEEFAVVHFIKTEEHPPHYERYGTGAPQIRNKQMVERGADGCLAFIKPCQKWPGTCKIKVIHGSHGASRTARLAEEFGIDTRRFTEGFTQ